MSEWRGGPGAEPAQGRLGIEVAERGARIAVGLPGARPQRVERLRRARFDRLPSPDEVIERIAALVEETERPLPSAVGVAVWGRVTHTRGEVADDRFGDEWKGFPFATRLAERLGAPVRLASGVNAAARAETLLGAGIGQSPLLYVHLGRTVTSALVIDGEPLLGAHDDAGRLGHWQTGLDGPRCVCGARGHLDPIISAQSLVRLAIGAVASDDAALAAVHRVTGGRAESLTVTQLVALAREGVAPLRALLDDALGALAGALANLSVTLDPQMIVIGGPLASVDDVFFAWLRERLDTRLSGVMPAPAIAAAALEPNAALLGAIGL